MSTIHTKWHRMLSELFEGVNVYFTAPPCSTATNVLDLDTDVRMVYRFALKITDVPRFVIAPDLLNMAKDENFHSSLLDMKRAGVFRLPYPTMTVEFSVDEKTHYMVFLRDLQHEHREEFEVELDSKLAAMPMYGAVFQMKKDGTGEYAVISPNVIFMDVVPEEEGSKKVMLQTLASSIGATPYTEKFDHICGITLEKDGRACGLAMLCALLLMTTEGVEREVVETHKLNKRRTGKDKQPIPRHTYIKIGRVYRSNGGDDSDVYDARKSPRPHWRRGYNRRVRTGKGRENFYWRWFPPRLVAFHPQEGDVAPDQKHEYRVSK